MRGVVITSIVVGALVVLAVALVQSGVISLSQPEPVPPPEVVAQGELFEAVKTEPPEALEALFVSGASAEARDVSGQTPLMIAAAQNDDPEVLRILLARGAEINARSESGWSALMYAAKEAENPEVLRILLNAGADPSLEDGEGRTALDIAAENGKVRRSEVFYLLESVRDRPYNPDWPMGFISPVQGATFSSRPSHLPGSRRAYRNGWHEGFDFYNGVVSVAIEYGTPVLATAAGTVVRADKDYTEMTPEAYQSLIDDARRRPITPAETLDKLRGRQVWIEHPGGFVSRYAHLSSIPEEIEVGTGVEPGDVVAFSGNSGTIEGVEGTNDDPHPHYELWRQDLTYLGEGMTPDEIYTLVVQVFGEEVLPPFREQ